MIQLIQFLEVIINNGTYHFKFLKGCFPQNFTPSILEYLDLHKGMNYRGGFPKLIHLHGNGICANYFFFMAIESIL